MSSPQSPSSNGLDITARWERSVVAGEGGQSALMLRITASTPLPTPGRRRVPLDVAFVLDRSGSMGGGKLDLAKEAVDVAARQLRDDDRAALVVFDNTIETVQPLQPATERTRTTLRLALQGIDTGGSTDLCGGWLAGCQELASTPDSDGQRSDGATRPRRTLLLTDGQANVGVTDPGQLMHHATELRRRGISTTTIGVGNDYDQPLLSGMAEAGGGNYEHIAQPAELRAFFSREIGDLLTMVGIAPRLELTLPHRVHGNLLNAFPARRAGKTITVDLSDLAAGDEVVLIVDCWTVSKTRDPSTIEHTTARLSWADPAADRREAIELTLPSLTLGTNEEAERAPVDNEVREAATRERAALSRREGIRLDYAGRTVEARARFRDAATMLSAIAQTFEVQAEHRESLMLAEADASVPLAEPVRRQRYAADHRRSRGRRT
ncbi:MAG: VWA domain-containing protein [Chloroflexia bacterium]|nr:VWA domain-containing protein [Chloroflexia bacterium]